jgi:MinD superfamily P-loop ATPase
MRIAIASGKGGTGKTTVATNLALILAESGRSATYVDCDVEAPNGHLFLKPVITGTAKVPRRVPVVDNTRCTHCGECAGFCRFNALTCLPNVTLVHQDLCHSCGGCSLVCPVEAIREEVVSAGIVETGHAGALRFVSGTFTVGLANSTPVIRAAKAAGGREGWVLFDAPPGTSCAMMETVKGVDYVILVTEPTPFGMHDLSIALEVAAGMKLPHGVIVNRSDEGTEEVRQLCAKAGVGILAELPYDLAVARAYSEGIPAVLSLPEWKQAFTGILTQLDAISGRDANNKVLS